MVAARSGAWCATGCAAPRPACPTRSAGCCPAWSTATPPASTRCWPSGSASPGSPTSSPSAAPTAPSWSARCCWCCAGCGCGRGARPSWARCVLVMFVVVARPSPSVLRAALMAGVALSALAAGRPRAAVPALAAVTLGAAGVGPDAGRRARPSRCRCWPPARCSWWRPGGRARCGAAGSRWAWPRPSPWPPRRTWSPRRSSPPSPGGSAWWPSRRTCWPSRWSRWSRCSASRPRWWRRCGWAGASALAWLAGWPCRWLVGVADFFGGLHGATPAVAGRRVGRARAARRARRPRRARHARRAAPGARGRRRHRRCWCCVPGRAATSAWPPGGWVFAACDVGQGDALLLNAGPGAAVEVDAGPDPVATDRCLRDLGIDRIPLLVLTHFHLDHVGGLAGAVRGRSVGAVLAGPLADPEGGVAIAHAVLASRGLRIVTPPVGYARAGGRGGPRRPRSAGGVPRTRGRTRTTPRWSCAPRWAGCGSCCPAMLRSRSSVRCWPPAPTCAPTCSRCRTTARPTPTPPSSPRCTRRWRSSPSACTTTTGTRARVLVDELARLGVPLRRTDHDGDVAVTAHDGALTTVVRGTASSTVGLGPPRGRTASPGPRTLPAPGRHPNRRWRRRWRRRAVRGWRHARPHRRRRRPARPAAAGGRRRRRRGVAGRPRRSARSPPPRAAPIRRSRSPS